MLEYKGFKASFQYASQTGTYVGELIDAPYVVAFSASNLSELKGLMQEAVEGLLLNN